MGSSSYTLRFFTLLRRPLFKASPFLPQETSPLSNASQLDVPPVHLPSPKRESCSVGPPHAVSGIRPLRWRVVKDESVAVSPAIRVGFMDGVAEAPVWVD
jgi:hypothetical protein